MLMSQCDEIYKIAMSIDRNLFQLSWNTFFYVNIVQHLKSISKRLCVTNTDLMIFITFQFNVDPTVCFHALSDMSSPVI